MSTTEARAQYSTIIVALSDLVMLQQTDRQCDDDVLPRDPVMQKVLTIRQAADELLRAALAAAAPPTLDSIEQYRMQMASISTAASGYWKEGDSIHPDYDTLALRDVAKLYAKYDELFRAAAAPSPAAGPLGIFEQRALMENPACLLALADHHDVMQDQSDAMGAETAGDAVRSKELRELARSIVAKDPEVWPREMLSELGFVVTELAAPGAHPAPAAQPVAIPQGWRLVPAEPTLEMMAACGYAGEAAHARIACVRDWRAMLAAAPAAPMLNGLTASETDGWPEMPPNKGQSPILFEDGYAEGWARCLQECQKVATLTAAETESAFELRCANCGKLHVNGEGWIGGDYPDEEAFCSEACRGQHDELGCPSEGPHSGFRHPVETADLLALRAASETAQTASVATDDDQPEYTDSEFGFLAEKLNEVADERKQVEVPAEPSAEPPEHDASKPDEQQGLYRKFDVRRTDGSSEPGGKHHDCRYFVLDVGHDRHAAVALTAYADAVEATHPVLANDMRAEFSLATTPARDAELSDEKDAQIKRQAEFIEGLQSEVSEWKALAGNMDVAAYPLHRLLQECDEQDDGLIAVEVVRRLASEAYAKAHAARGAILAAAQEKLNG